MNTIFNNRNRISWVFLAGYIALIVYSGFHYHKIEIQNSAEFSCAHPGTQPVNNDPVNSLFACHFSSFYNSNYTFDNTASVSFSLVVLAESDFFNIIIIPSRDFSSSNQLRAPPAFPVFC